MIDITALLEELDYPSPLVNASIDDITELSGFPRSLFRAIVAFQEGLRGVFNHHKVGAIVIRASPTQFISDRETAHKPVIEKAKWGAQQRFDAGLFVVPQNDQLLVKTRLALAEFSITAMELAIKIAQRHIFATRIESELYYYNMADINSTKWLKPSDTYDETTATALANLRSYKLTHQHTTLLSAQEAAYKRALLQIQRPQLHDLLMNLDISDDSRYQVWMRESQREPFVQAQVAVDNKGNITTTDSDIFNLPIIPFHCFERMTKSEYDDIFIKAVDTGLTSEDFKADSPDYQPFVRALIRLTEYCQLRHFPMVMPKLPEGISGYGKVTAYDLLYIYNVNALNEMFTVQIKAAIAAKLNLSAAAIDYKAYSNIASAAAQSFLANYDAVANRSTHPFQHGPEALHPDPTQVKPFGVRLVVAASKITITENAEQYHQATLSFEEFLIQNQGWIDNEDDDTSQIAASQLTSSIDNGVARPCVKILTTIYEHRASSSASSSRSSSRVTTPIASPIGSPSPSRYAATHIWNEKEVGGQRRHSMPSGSINPRHEQTTQSPPNAPPMAGQKKSSSSLDLKR